MKTRKDYLDLHLKCDVLLLADVFEKTQKQYLQEIWIMSESLFGAPALRWDAMH